MKNFTNIIFTSFFLFYCFGISITAFGADAQAPTPDQLKAEFLKCYLCKTMVPYMDKPWFHSTSYDIINVKNGMLTMETLGDLSGMPEYTTMWNAFAVAGEEVKKFSEQDIQTKLCGICQGMCSLMRDGAMDEWFLTKSGSIGLFTSQNPEVIKKIHAYADNMRQIFSQQK